MARRVITDEMLETIKEFHEAGLTVTQIAQELGVSQPTVYKYHTLLELAPNGRKSRDADAFEVLQAYQDPSRTVNSILQEYHVSTTALYGMIRRAGLKPRQRSADILAAKEAQMEHALDLYQNSDLTIMKICMETGVSQPVLHREVREREIPFRNPRMAAPLYTPEGKQINKSWDD